MKTLEDTITALECCCQYNSCLGCPYWGILDSADGGCVKSMGSDALLHLIKLKAKAERLEDREK